MWWISLLGVDYPSQLGFLQARLCLTNMLCFFEEITKLIDEGSPEDIIYLDFQNESDGNIKSNILKFADNTK